MHPLNLWNIFQNVHHTSARQLYHLLPHLFDEKLNKASHFYTFGPGQGFNHFYSPHFHDLVHRQDVNCVLYAQAIGQVQEGYQRYTLKNSEGKQAI